MICTVIKNLQFFLSDYLMNIIQLLENVIKDAEIQKRWLY